jgi:hypothetical protein
MCACGRYGFDQLESNAVDDLAAPTPDFFVSPFGNDAASGTLAAPWKTFGYAFSKLSPGTTLGLLDGDYGPMDVDCSAAICNGSACPQGTQTSPISVVAVYPRTAALFGDGSEALLVENCQHWRFYGLQLRGADRLTDPVHATVMIRDSLSVELRNSLVVGVNRESNNHAVEVSSSRQTLISDVEIYSFHRAAIVIFGGNNTVVRRAYMNGRGAIDRSFATEDPSNGDYGVLIYYSGDNLIEDSVAERVLFGFFVSTGLNAAGVGTLGDNNVLVGNAAIGPGGYGFIVATDCDSLGSLCSEPPLAIQLAENNEISDSVAVGYTVGFAMIGGRNNRFVRNSSFFATETNMRASSRISNGFISDASISDSLAVGNNTGKRGMTDDATTILRIFHSNSYGHTPDFQATALQQTQSTDPAFGACTAFPPAGSAMAVAGIGADLRFQFVNGVKTTKRLWDLTSGSFPCGTIYPGINDSVDSCRHVHERLGIGNGCPVY